MFKLFTASISFLATIFIGGFVSIAAIGSLYFIIRNGHHLSYGATAAYRIGACLLACASFASVSWFMSSRLWVVAGRWACCFATFGFCLLFACPLLDDRTLGHSEYLALYQFAIIGFPTLASYIAGYIGACKRNRHPDAW